MWIQNQEKDAEDTGFPNEAQGEEQTGETTGVRSRRCSQ